MDERPASCIFVSLSEWRWRRVKSEPSTLSVAQCFRSSESRSLESLSFSSAWKEKRGQLFLYFANKTVRKSVAKPKYRVTHDVRKKLLLTLIWKLRFSVRSLYWNATFKSMSTGGFDEPHVSPFTAVKLTENSWCLWILQRSVKVLVRGLVKFVPAS